MKYVIKESRLEQAIINHLNLVFDVDNIHSTTPHEYDYDTGEDYYDENVVIFYIGDYDDGDNDVFTWFDCGFFTKNSSARKLCPKVVIKESFYYTLTGYFGDKWEEPFRKWFRFNFELPIKTIEYDRLR
jgi:hypothetical protein